MTVRDLGAEYGLDDPDDGWFGAAGPAEDTPPRSAAPPPRPGPPPPPPVRPVIRDESEADTDRWFVRDMAPAEPVRTADPRPARVAEPSAWEFKSSRPARRRPPRALPIAAAALAGVAVVVGVVLLVRSPGEQSAPVPVTPSSAAPAPSTSAPAVATVAPVPPPPVLPPPPPPPPETAPPVVTRDYSPSYQTPDEPKKPQQNVTRAPLSATPPPPPRQTDRGRATPGQSGAHGFFG